MNRLILSIALGVTLTAIARAAEKLPESAGYGANPVLPEPEKNILPTVEVAKATPWGPGETPTPADGFKVTALARDLKHPRFVHVLPNGDILVVETNAPADRPEEKKGLRAKIMGVFMKKTGSATPSANQITLLRDADGNGAAEVRTVFLSGLNSPFGVALTGGQLYIANTDGIVRVPYKDGDTQVTTMPVKVTDLPAGPRNHHWTKTVVASADGKKLYASVGSNSNVAENGMAEEENRACIFEIDAATGAKRILATGLRNAAGLAIQPQSGALWAAVNERDELGDNLVPDYMTGVKDGAFYGWPYSYYGQHLDQRVKTPNPAMVATAIKPDYALGSHTASLGLAFNTGKGFPAKYAGGAFIGQHGSWNSSKPVGYRVVFVPFEDGRPVADLPEVILNGFLDKDGNAHGRPVGVAIDRAGALLVADDVGNTIWRVTANVSP